MARNKVNHLAKFQVPEHVVGEKPWMAIPAAPAVRSGSVNTAQGASVGEYRVQCVT